MTESDSGQRAMNRAGRYPGLREATPGRRSRLWEKSVTGVVVLAFVFGPVALLPAPVAAQQCPPQQVCPPPPPPPDNPPDDGSGGGGGGGGGQKNDGGQKSPDPGQGIPGQDGGRHGRDEGRPDLSALAASDIAGGSEQGASVISAPVIQQPLPIGELPGPTSPVITDPQPIISSAVDPVPDTPLPVSPVEETVTAPLTPLWPLPVAPPPGYGELMEDLPVPDHSETVAVIDEQIVAPFQPRDLPGPSPIATLPAIELAPGTNDLFTTILNQVLNIFAPTPFFSSPTPTAPIPSLLLEVLAFIRRDVLDTLPRP